MCVWGNPSTHQTKQIFNFFCFIMLASTSGSVLRHAMFINRAGSREGDALGAFFWLRRNPVQSCNFYEMLSVYESSGSRRSRPEGQAAPAHCWQAPNRIVLPRAVGMLGACDGGIIAF